MVQKHSTRQILIEALKKEAKAILTERQTLAASYDWDLRARPSQKIPPGDWRIWLILAGRGFGKTRTGAETIRRWATSGRYGRMALVADTESEARDVMVEGESGLLAVHPQGERPKFEPSRRLLTWPNGAKATIYSAENPEKLRGPQFDCAWVDELCKYREADALWAQLNMGLRLGTHPRIVVTTTPRPMGLLTRLLGDRGGSVALTTGATSENVQNLAPAYMAQMLALYGGTRFARQELDGAVLDAPVGALWSRALLAKAQHPGHIPRTFFKQVVIAVDPAVTSGENSDETGIIVGGLGSDGHGYILADLSGKYPPATWARLVVDAAKTYQVNTIIAEVNQGGDLVETMLKTINPDIRYQKVHARTSKRTRAEPIAALYDQGRIHHYPGLIKLEEQMATYHPGGGGSSPDRLDAAIWALTHLMLNPDGSRAPRAWLL